jgi:hypothetical protein
MDVDFDLERAQWLVRMTTLRKLEPRYVTPDALQLFARGLPDLRTLKLNLDTCWRVEADGYDCSLVRDSLAACRQLAALTRVWAPVEELLALLLALPPSVCLLTIHESDGLHRMAAILQCVSSGGLRHVHQLLVRLSWWDWYDAREVAEWRTRMVDCAPWINAHTERDT